MFQSEAALLFLGNGVLKTCSPVCSHVNLLHIFRTTFPENSPGGLLLPECFGEGSEKAPGGRNY